MPSIGEKVTKPWNPKPQTTTQEPANGASDLDIPTFLRNNKRK